MDAKDIRVGNLVTVLNGGPVIAITPQHIVAISEGDTIYKPIPLTAEWWGRMGFVNGRNHGGKVLLRVNEIGDYLDENVMYVFHNDARGHSHIRFVHQFQNYFYATTGTELTLKMEKV